MENERHSKKIILSQVKAKESKIRSSTAIGHDQGGPYDQIKFPITLIKHIHPANISSNIA